MAEPDEWYYLDNSKTLGPVSTAELVRLIRSRSIALPPKWRRPDGPKWMDASQALAAQLARPDPSLDAASTRRAYGIKVRCVSGPDAGKAFMIGASELSLGRVAGIGQNDPQVAENHVVLSWQDNTLHYRTLGGAKLKVAGADSTQGALSNGQTFGLGASTWQVGTAPVELASLLSSLAARLNKLATPEKLEGFSLKTMFSEVFKARKPGEVEDYFSVGTAKTTPPLEEVQTGWPKPWFFMRVLIFMLALYLVMSKTIDWFGNPRMVPGLMVIGSFAVPLATLVLFWELNTPRNVSFVQVLTLMCLGGVISLFVTHLVGDIASLGGWGTPAPELKRRLRSSWR